jgi:hypothetical protein
MKRRSSALLLGLWSHKCNLGGHSNRLGAIDRQSDILYSLPNLINRNLQIKREGIHNRSSTTKPM